MRRLRRVRCEQGRTIAGRRCEDVEGLLVHLALSDIGDAATRARLQAIPTGLTIPREGVDTLVSFGERLARENAAIARLVQDDPAPAPAAVEARRTSGSVRRRDAPR